MNKIKTLTGDEALDELMNYFLGDDYYIVDPLHATQANAVIVDDIKMKHRYEKRKYNKAILLLSCIAIIEFFIILYSLRLFIYG